MKFEPGTWNQIEPTLYQEATQKRWCVCVWDLNRIAGLLVQSWLNLFPGSRFKFHLISENEGSCLRESAVSSKSLKVAAFEEDAASV